MTILGQSRFTLLVGAWLLAGSAPTWTKRRPRAPRQGPPHRRASPGLSGTELEVIIFPLAADGVDERRAAAAALASLGAGATPAIAKKLADLRKTGDGGTYSAVKAARERSRAVELQSARGSRDAEA